MNNHQDKTHNSALKMEERYMGFAGIFLSTSRINVSEVSFKRQIVRTEWIVYGDKGFSYTYSNNGGNVNLELINSHN